MDPRVYSYSNISNVLLQLLIIGKSHVLVSVKLMNTCYMKSSVGTPLCSHVEIQQIIH